MRNSEGLRPRGAAHASRAALLGLGLLLAPAAAECQQSAGTDAAPTAIEEDRARARKSFELGLELARSGRYEEAKQEFSNAYRAHPHHAVLYNIAQADIRLGNTAAAIAGLERFLLEGGAALSEEQRAGAQRQLDELRARVPKEAPAAPPSSGEAALPPDSAPASPPPPGVVSPRLTAPPPYPPFAGVSSAPHVSATPSRRVASGREEEVTTPWGWILASTGAALLGTAAGLYIWNGQRHEKWEEERQALDAIDDLEVLLRSDLQLWNDAKENNELLSSIQTIDVVALLLAGAGTLSLGAGAWELVARPAPPALSASGASVSWRTRW